APAARSTGREPADGVPYGRRGQPAGRRGDERRAHREPLVPGAGRGAAGLTATFPRRSFKGPTFVVATLLTAATRRLREPVDGLPDSSLPTGMPTMIHGLRAESCSSSQLSRDLCYRPAQAGPFMSWNRDLRLPVLKRLEQSGIVL